MKCTIHMNGFHTNERHLLSAENLYHMPHHHRMEVTTGVKRVAL